MTEINWADLIVFVGSVSVSIVSALITFRVRFERMEAMDNQRTADRREFETRALAEASVARQALDTRIAQIEMQMRAYEHQTDARWLEFGADHGRVVANIENLTKRIDHLERRHGDDTGRFKT